MYDVYRKTCFSPKISTNGLKMGLLLWAWVEKSDSGVK